MSAKRRTILFCFLAVSLLFLKTGPRELLTVIGEERIPTGKVEASTLSASADAGAPALFFTDITSGPKDGGQENLGVFITIYGEGFGEQRGSSTVTLGGVEVAKYVTWGQDNAVARKLDMIIVQPGPNAASGNILVTVGGKASNPLPFTLRSGQIYFVIPNAPNASDTNPGTYTSPFKTLYRPRQVFQAGDIAYIKGGTYSASDPAHLGWDGVLCLFTDTDTNGTVDRPIAYIGYPGDPPVLGGPAPMRRGILVDQAMNYYIFANLRFTQRSGILELSGNGHRAIGNYSYDGIYSNSGVIGVAGDTAHLKVYGNYLRNNGEVGNKLNGSGFYIQGFGTNQDIDFGWNQVQDQRGARAIQLFGHRSGDRMNDIRIHDNLLSGSELNNMVLGGSDGSTEVLGTVHVYNNIIIGSGDPGLRVNDPQGTVYIRNNVLYNNGSPGYNGKEQIYIQQGGTGLITLQNNIIYAEAGQSYFLFEPGASSAAFGAANNNLVYNAGACPAWGSGCINANPLFMGLASLDFRLQAQSPAINAGMNSGIAQDYIGVSRPQGGAYDIGAYEYTGSTGSTVTTTAAATSTTTTIQSTTTTISNTTTTLPASGGTTLLLNNRRFLATVNWVNYNDGSRGVGQAVGLTSDSGYFWFFNAANVELIVKVLDGRPINGKFWVLFGALSDVEYTLTVTDSQTGAVKTYYNPPRTLASRADVNAF